MEDMTTDQRAHRHPTKSANYTEVAQGVKDDNLSPDFQPLKEDDADRAHNKATASEK